MQTVFLVARMDYIEDYYMVPEVVKAFSTREAADTWVGKQKAEDALLRAAVERAREIRKTWAAEHPFTFSEMPPPPRDRWPAGLKQQDITPEMRATRAAQERAAQEYDTRYRQALAAHDALEDAHLAEVWKAEGQVVNLEDFPRYISTSRQAEFEITEMPVET